MKPGFVYILASERNGTLYTGVTSDLKGRIYVHREAMVEGFSKKYFTKKLVYYEAHDDIRCAISREKQIKKWRRKWKLRLIEEFNPEWLDLYEGLF